jgi:probable HAF family extracellular repeat protein
MTQSFPWKTLRCRLAFWLAFSSLAPIFGQTYLITDLNNPGDSYKLAYAINSTGNVVGEYEPADLITVSAFCYNHGTNTDLGMLPGYIDAYAHGINDSNQVVGWCDVYAGTERGFLYSKGGMTPLGTLATSPGPTGGWSRGYGIDRSGQVVGTATLSNNVTYHAVLWSGATKKDLGSLGGAIYNSTAYGINDSGVIVGESEVTDSAYTHAFRYSNNVMTDLQTLPGGAYSRAYALNNAGVIVGESETLTGAGLLIHAFVCPNGPGSMQDLGTLGGGESSANAINSAGHIVGYAVNSNNISRAFLYDGSKMVDLNSLIPPGSGFANLEAAVGINDSGQIAGYGTFSDGVYHGFLLTPAGPLTVAITNPSPNATFTAPATFLVAASATDTAGTVTNVQLLVNGPLIGEAASAACAATASNLAAGAYTLTAIASDNGGLKATNTIGITVRAALAPITISNPTLTGATFSFSFGTQSGYSYAGQFTTPLSGTSNTWLTFTNLAGDGSTVRVTDSTATNSERYYRVVAQ